MIKTVLFDLDDTIYDHKHSRLCALNALRIVSAPISRVPLEELEKEHELLISRCYASDLGKKQTLMEGITKEICLLFSRFGIDLSKEDAARYAEVYKQTYEDNRRAVPGVVELIKALRASTKVGIVSNGIYSIQMSKLKICRIENLIDFMIVSEDVGARKPQKAIFEAALRKSNSRPQEAVFVGAQIPFVHRFECMCEQK